MKTDSKQKIEKSENAENLKANSENPQHVLSATLGNLVNYLIKDQKVNTPVIFDLQNDEQNHTLTVIFSVAQKEKAHSLKAIKNNASVQDASGVEADHSAETEEEFENQRIERIRKQAAENPAAEIT